MDQVGIVRGCPESLQSQIAGVGVNAGDKPGDDEQLVNLRAEMSGACATGYWAAVGSSP